MRCLKCSCCSFVALLVCNHSHWLCSGAGCKRALVPLSTEMQSVTQGESQTWTAAAHLCLLRGRGNGRQPGLGIPWVSCDACKDIGLLWLRDTVKIFVPVKSQSRQGGENRRQQNSRASMGKPLSLTQLCASARALPACSCGSSFSSHQVLARLRKEFPNQALTFHAVIERSQSGAG